MVDFRKWLFASAAAALLFGLGGSAYAQTGSSAFICTASAGNPNIVRSEGVAELVGDLVLNCTGGSVTPYGTPIPLSNVQISLNTNVTSRLVGSGPGDFATEAILTIDEPFPGANGQTPYPSTATPVQGAATTQSGCVADGTSGCQILGTGTALNFGNGGPYNGITNQLSPGPHFNVFQGIANGGANQINWQGVPIDAPGTTGTRIIRITNIRANACMLAGGSSLVPTTITELIGVSGSQTIIINGPLQTVALIEKGLTSSINAPVGAPSYQQCNNLNAFLLQSGGGNGTPDNPFFITITATEGFGAAFKPVSFFQGGFYGQNVLGTSYNTETGYTPIGVGGLDQSGRFIGLADTGTQIQFTLTGIPSGVQIFAPSSIPLVGPGGGLTTVSTSSGCAAPEWSGGTTDPQQGNTASYAFLSTATVTTFDANPPSTPPGGATFCSFSSVTVNGTTATITYQIGAANPNIVESLIVPIEAAYLTSSSTVPLPGTTSATVNFAPLATSTNQGVASGPIPRFCQPYGPAAGFIITPCTCNLLFPFVTNQAGFDTGIAIANTSSDPYGTANQTGAVNLWYYGNVNGGPAPPLATSQPVPAGQILTFQVSSPGTFGVPATAGFQGYIIAQAEFQFCHGFAFISDVGAQKLAEGYLAISLDQPAYNLRGGPGATFSTSFGENMGH
jgi:hypothetical protein